LAGNHNFGDAIRQWAKLFGSSACGGGMDSKVPYLNIATILELWMEARVPQNKHVEIRAIPDQQSKAPF
jgi:hypothetical protein